MKREISVLRCINSEGNTTQRDIAKSTGMSLGNVNAAIKSLISKGLLHKKPSNERDVQYVLTDEGKRRKSIALHNEYSEIIGSTFHLQKKIEKVINDCCVRKGLKPILVGENDEIHNYLIKTLKTMKIEYEAIKLEDLPDINNKLEDTIFLIWHFDLEEILKNDGFRYIHILNEIDKRTVQ